MIEMEGNYIMNNIFTKENSNTKRQLELDIAKGLAIIFMVWVHVNEYYQGTLYHGGTYNRIVEFLGSPPAAPVFMILLGTGAVYSRSSTPKKLAVRGMKLLFGGYLFSFFRDAIPYALLYVREEDKALITEGLDLLWGVDILQFAGLALMFLALIKKFRLSNKVLFIIWCAFASIHLVVRDITFSSTIANRFFGLFWGTNSYSWFPFLNWITFPMVGYVFGTFLIRCTDKKVFYKTIFIWSSAISVPLWIYSYINNIQFGAFGELWQDAYYHHDIIGTMVLLSFALFWMSLVFFVTPYVPELLQKAFSRWSKHTTKIYCVSYIILGVSILGMETESLEPAMVCLLAAIIFVLSDLYCLISDKMKKYRVSLSVGKTANSLEK